MTAQKVLLDGVELVVFGVGLVFAFLIVLIFCIRLMSSLVERYFPTDSSMAVTTRPASLSASAAWVDADTMMAIELALKQHRAQNS